MASVLPHEVSPNFVRLSQDRQIISKMDEDDIVQHCYAKASNLCIIKTGLKKGLNLFYSYYNGIGASNSSNDAIALPSINIPTDDIIFEYLPKNTNEIARTIEDTSGNYLHGTLVGSPTLNGNALNFYNNNHILVPSHNFVGLRGFALTIWLYDKRVESGALNIVGFHDISEDQNICLRKVNYSNDQMEIQVGSRSKTWSSIRYFDWSHYVWTIDSDGNSKVYRDGVYVTGYSQQYPANVMRITNCIGNGWYGGISNIRVYSRNLEENEIQILCKEGFGDNDLPKFNSTKVFPMAEDGTWIIDEQSYVSRRKFGVVSNQNYDEALIFVPREKISTDETIRIVKCNINNKYMLPVIPTAVSSITSIVPKNKDYSFKNVVAIEEERKTGVIEKKGLDVESTPTANIGFLTNIQTRNVKLIIDWIRIRKSVSLEPIQLKQEDAAIIFKKLETDWYLFDTEQIQVADKITIDTTIAETIHSSSEIIKKKWLDFPEQSNFSTNIPYEFKIYS